MQNDVPILKRKVSFERSSSSSTLGIYKKDKITNPYEAYMDENEDGV